MPRSMRSPEVGSGTAAQLPSVRSVRSRQETNIAQTPELQAVATFDCAAKVQRTAEDLSLTKSVIVFFIAVYFTNIELHSLLFLYTLLYHFQEFWYTMRCFT